jgi:hypothetical protein
MFTFEVPVHDMPAMLPHTYTYYVFIYLWKGKRQKYKRSKCEQEIFFIN